MKRNLWHKIDPCEAHPDGKDWHLVELHATDAMHALDVDPDHWKTDKPEAEIMATSHDETEIGDEA